MKTVAINANQSEFRCREKKGWVDRSQRNVGNKEAHNKFIFRINCRAETENKVEYVFTIFHYSQ